MEVFQIEHGGNIWGPSVVVGAHQFSPQEQCSGRLV